MSKKKQFVTNTRGKFAANGSYGDVDGKKVNFTPELLDMIYNNIKGPIPYYIDHNTAIPNREIVGYANTIDFDKDALFHIGCIDNDIAVKKIKSGYDKVSPEIDIEYDQDLKKITDAKLTAISYVRAAGIDGTDTMLFSADVDLPVSIGDNVKNAEELLKSKGLTDFEIAAIRNEFGTKAPENVPAAAPPVSTPTEVPKIPESAPDAASEFSAQFAEIKKLIESQNVIIQGLQTSNNNLMGDKVTSMVAELEQRGLKNVKSVVENLPYDQQIAVLGNLNKSVAGSQPMISGNTPTGAPPTATDAKVAEDAVLTELGFTRAQYDKLLNHNTENDNDVRL